ncbi:MAG: hypothetical protein ACTSPV_13240, partial [Candidatus Hodarchaeales archaeon]
GIPIRMPRYIPRGRIEENLRISTILFRISFFKTYYQHQKSSTLRKAAHFIETFDKDLTGTSRVEINKLPILKQSIPYILEYLDKGKSHYLESIGQADNLFYN